MVNVLDRRRLRVVVSVAPECLAILVMLFLIWWGILTTLTTEYRGGLAAAARDTANLARAFDENTERIFSGANQVLLSLRAAIKREGDRFSLVAWIAHESAPDWLTSQIGIIDPDGFLGSTSVRPAEPIYLGDRQHFTAQRDTRADNLFISKPVLGRVSQRWTVQLSRKILSEDGRFLGVAVLSLDCIRLSDFYERTELSDGYIALAGDDGVVLARGPVVPGELGARLPLFDAVRQSSAATVRRGEGTAAQTVSYRKLKSRPLFVVVGLNDTSALAGYRRLRTQLIWSGCGATLSVILIGAAWLVQRRRSYASQRALEVMLENVSQGIVMLDARQRVSVINARALEFLAMPTGSLGRVRSGRFDCGIRERLIGYFADQPFPGQAAEMTPGRVLERQVSPTPEGGVVCTITDITDRHQADLKLRHMAMHDQLTGLGNRLLFEFAVERLMTEAQRDEAAFGLLCLDLDGFKTINDTLGHKAGDVVLIETGRRLEAVVREDDVVVRMGGDEFTVLSKAGRNPKAYLALADRIQAAIGAPFWIGEREVGVGVSVGISIYPADGLTQEELICNSDLALYAAKADRRHPVQIFTRILVDEAQRKSKLEQELRQALEQREFFLEYQPQFDVQTLRICGFEALIRWAHPSKGRIAPDLFIPMAEELGLIVEIGSWTLAEACETALPWPEDVRVAVNLSPVQFRDPRLVGRVQETLAATGLSPARLVLEVTEGVIIADENQALETLNALRALGINVALDDFGTGYAGLSYLRKYPFDKIKLDRSFVQDQEGRSRRVLGAILDLSRTLNLTTLAEGVETQQQLDVLREQGCHAVQGFLLGRPMNSADAGALIEQSRKPPALIAGPPTKDHDYGQVRAA